MLSMSDVFCFIQIRRDTSTSSLLVVEYSSTILVMFVHCPLFCTADVSRQSPPEALILSYKFWIDMKANVRCLAT